MCIQVSDKRQIYHIIEWLVALAGCGYLVWRLATYEDYASMWASLRAMNAAHICALLVCVALMPLNMGIEAWRWKTLVPMSWREAHVQVYYSKLAGLITPWRLGEYPARGLLMEKSQWGKVLSMGAVGSATMTAAIIASGLLAMISAIRFQITDIRFSYFITTAIILLLLAVVLFFAPRLLRRWVVVSHRLVLLSTAQSMVRLLCWCVQLGLVLWALGAIPNFPFSIFNVFIYYLLVTITPSVPVAEVGVRGAWAIVLFGSPTAALAGVLLWGINTLLPCLAWFFFKKKQEN